MDENLVQVDIDLRHLEKQIIIHYERLEATAPPNMVYLMIPFEEAQGYLAALEALNQRLHGGSGMLQLVTDDHDQLRIRTVVLRNLLEREIPKPYLGRVISEIRDTSTPTDSPVSPFPASADAGQTAERASGGMFGRFDGDEQDRQRPASGSPPRFTAPQHSDSGSGSEEDEALPVEVMRTMGLHYLMEEDTQKLVKPDQAMPRVTQGSQLPASLARFVAKDLAEAHFATRPLRPKIARTPDELRRKLADRERGENKSP